MAPMSTDDFHMSTNFPGTDIISYMILTNPTLLGLITFHPKSLPYDIAVNYSSDLESGTSLVRVRDWTVDTQHVIYPNTPRSHKSHALQGKQLPPQRTILLLALRQPSGQTSDVGPNRTLRRSAYAAYVYLFAAALQASRLYFDQTIHTLPDT